MDSFSDAEGLFEELNAGIYKIGKEVIMDLESEESNEGCTTERMDNGYENLRLSADGMAHAKAKREKVLSDAPLDTVTEEWALKSPYDNFLGELSSTDDSRDVDVNNNPQLKSKAPFAWADLHLLVNGSLRTAEEPSLRARQEIRNHRSQNAEAVWEGILPPKEHRWPTCSPKVFLGGIPFGITQDELLEEFSKFGDLQIVWPKSRFDFRHGHRAGHVHIVFQSQKQVKSLVSASKHNAEQDSCSYEVSTSRWATRKVEVIAWLTFDRDYYSSHFDESAPQNTVFVGGLHGTVTAVALAHIMGTLFGEVTHAGIDVDKYQYPIGSGRVSFKSHRSFVKAIIEAYVMIKTPKFTKKVQVDPYVATNAVCSDCRREKGSTFCRDLHCLRHFCQGCWRWQHAVDGFQHHVGTMRTMA